MFPKVHQPIKILKFQFALTTNVIEVAFNRFGECCYITFPVTCNVYRSHTHAHVYLWCLLTSKFILWCLVISLSVSNSFFCSSLLLSHSKMFWGMVHMKQPRDKCWNTQKFETKLKATNGIVFHWTHYCVNKQHAKHENIFKGGMVLNVGGKRFAAIFGNPVMYLQVTDFDRQDWKARLQMGKVIFLMHVVIQTCIIRITSNEIMNITI